MKKSILSAALIVASLLTIGTSAQAFPINAIGYVGAESVYYWRGVEQSPNPAVLAGVKLSSGYLSLSADETTLATTRQIESDLTIDVTLPATKYFDFSVGSTSYVFTGFNPKVKSTTDLYIGTSGHAFGFNLFTKGYRQVQSKDIWIDLGASFEFSGFNVSGSTSYAMWKSINVKNRFEVLTLGASKDFVYSGLDLNAGFETSRPLNGNMIGLTNTQNLYNGTIKLSF